MNLFVLGLGTVAIFCILLATSAVPLRKNWLPYHPLIIIGWLILVAASWFFGVDLTGWALTPMLLALAYVSYRRIEWDIGKRAGKLSNRK